MLQSSSDWLLSAVWLVPFSGFLLLAFSYRQSEVFVATLARIVSKICAVTAVGLVVQWAMSSQDLSGGFEFNSSYLPIHIDVALHYDRISAVFSLLTAFFQLVIVRFSRVYLHREPGFSRFFSLICLLATGMQLLAISDNLVVFFVGWELIGIASFFLVAFYRWRQKSALNALKIMSAYRVGDLGLVLGMVFFHAIQDLPVDVRLSVLPSFQLLPSDGITYVLPLGIGVIVAAAAKSAQFPFTFWLPKAMEGPTPSSAIFYGALSVHAGALLLLRLYPLLSQLPYLVLLIGLVGLLTLLLAGGASRVQTSIKGQLAYSSAAQVGLIFIEISLGWHGLALYHIVCHALVRAFQLLLSPSVINRYMALQSENPNKVHFSNWSIGKYLPSKIRSTLYVLALHDNYLEHGLDFLLLNQLKRIQSNARLWMTVGLVAAASLVLAIATTQTSANTILLVIVGQAILAAVFAMCERKSATRSVDWMGLSVLMVATAMVVADRGFDGQTSMITALMIVFWVALRWMVDHERRSLSGFSGLYVTNPSASWKILIAVAGLIGIPPLPGFFFEDHGLMLLMHHSSWVAVLAGVALAINSIAGFRLFALVTMGPEPRVALD